MTASTDFVERLIPVQQRESDTSAVAWLDDHGLPTHRDEAWKYTPLREILSRPSRRATTPALHHLTTRDVDDMAGDHGAVRLVFVNGFFDTDLSTVTDLDGVVCTNMSSFPDRARQVDGIFGSVGQLDRIDGFQALNHVAANDAALIRIEPDVRVASPIHIVHVSLPGDAALADHPRTSIHAMEGSNVTVIETYTGRAAGGFTNATTTLRVDRGAVVSHDKIQAGPPGSVHLGHLRVRQAADSSVRSCSINLGADIARTAVDVILDGPGAHAELVGLYLPTGTQHHDHAITVDHAGSGCTSNQLFKGAIADHGRGSFSGHVIVRPGTTGTDANQTSRSLLLAATAEADARPWLEILSDDVRCTHGATVGRLDHDALFYLRTRGVPEHDARLMLIDAFVNEILDTIAVDTLRAHVQSAIVAKRAEAPSIAEPEGIAW